MSGNSDALPAGHTEKTSIDQLHTEYSNTVPHQLAIQAVLCPLLITSNPTAPNKRRQQEKWALDSKVRINKLTLAMGQNKVDFAEHKANWRTSKPGKMISRLV